MEHLVELVESVWIPSGGHVAQLVSDGYPVGGDRLVR